MLAFSRTEVLWQQQRGLRVHSATVPPGVEAFVLAPENVWYCRARLLFDMSVKVDTSEDPIEMKCAFVLVLDDSGESQKYAISDNIHTYLIILDHIC